MAALLLIGLAGPVRAEGTKVELRLDSRIPAKTADAVRKRLSVVLGQAGKRLAAAGLDLKGIRRIEVVATDRYTRYVGWREGNGGAMRMALPSLADDSPDFTALAISLEVARRHTGDKQDDPYRRLVRGKFLVGSVYDDVDNGPFYAAAEKALALTEKLPPAQRRAIEIVDAIHYVPHSRHFPKSNVVDNVVGTYQQSLGEPGNRMIFIRRDIRWTSEVGLALLLVHEGTHALQHAAVEKAAASGTDPEMVDAWRGREKDEKGISKAMRFECEATINEIKAAIALDAPPELVERSQYLRICDEPRALLAQWRDRRLKQGLERERANGRTGSP
jgi:hypothetical protein